MFVLSESPSAFAPSFPTPLSENHNKAHDVNPSHFVFLFFVIHCSGPRLSVWCLISAFHTMPSLLHHQFGCLSFIIVSFCIFKWHFINRMNHSLCRLRYHTLPFTLNDSEIDLAPSGPIPLSVNSWFINNSFHQPMT